MSDHIYKPLFVGNKNSGKTQLMSRVAEGTFNDSYIPTTGIGFKIKTQNIRGKAVKAQMWDAAGQERFRTITTAYCRSAHVISIFIDATETLEEAKKQYNEHYKRINESREDAVHDAVHDVVHDVVIRLILTKSDKLSDKETPKNALGKDDNWKTLLTEAGENNQPASVMLTSAKSNTMTVLRRGDQNIEEGTKTLCEEGVNGTSPLLDELVHGIDLANLPEPKASVNLGRRAPVLAYKKPFSVSEWFNNFFLTNTDRVKGTEKNRGHFDLAVYLTNGYYSAKYEGFKYEKTKLTKAIVLERLGIRDGSNISFILNKMQELAGLANDIARPNHERYQEKNGRRFGLFGAKDKAHLTGTQLKHLKLLKTVYKALQNKVIQENSSAPLSTYSLIPGAGRGETLKTHLEAFRAQKAMDGVNFLDVHRSFRLFDKKGPQPKTATAKAVDRAINALTP